MDRKILFRVLWAAECRDQNLADLPFARMAKGLIFSFPFLQSNGPALYVQRAMYSVSFSGPLHVARHVNPQP